MKIRWPPRPLGLGTPLNLAAASRETRPLLSRWWLVPVLGLATALLVVSIAGSIGGGDSSWPF